MAPHLIATPKGEETLFDLSIQIPKHLVLLFNVRHKFRCFFIAEDRKITTLLFHRRIPRRSLCVLIILCLIYLIESNPKIICCQNNDIYSIESWGNIIKYYCKQLVFLQDNLQQTKLSDLIDPAKTFKRAPLKAWL